MQSNVGVIWTLGSASGRQFYRHRCTMHWYNSDDVLWNDQSVYKRADISPSSRQLATLNPYFAFMPCAQC